MALCNFWGVLDNQRIMSEQASCRIIATFREYLQLFGTA